MEPGIFIYHRAEIDRCMRPQRGREAARRERG